MNKNAGENVDYNGFAKTFSKSRKNMKWEEISYFLKSPHLISPKGREIKNTNILDIGCGNGRFLGELKNIGINKEKYLGVDLSIGLIEEARKIHPGFNFKELNMLDLNKLYSNSPVNERVVGDEVGYMFFIASFHHLNSIEGRLKVLKDTYSLLEKGGMIFMTNWALDSELNKQKYNNSIIEGSENDFGSTDYNIKIGKFNRFYHCFSLEELEYLSKKSGFKIIENRLFNIGKNNILILKKP